MRIKKEKVMLHCYEQDFLLKYWKYNNLILPNSDSHVPPSSSVYSHCRPHPHSHILTSISHFGLRRFYFLHFSHSTFLFFDQIQVYQFWYQRSLSNTETTSFSFSFSYTVFRHFSLSTFLSFDIFAFRHFCLSTFRLFSIFFSTFLPFDIFTFRPNSSLPNIHLTKKVNKNFPTIL
jgi:hypothetical protein